MGKTIKNIGKIAGVMIGLMVGAGFASGQELMTFFLVYGSTWIWGILLAGALFFLAGWAVLEIIRIFQLDSYQKFLQVVMGKRIGGVFEILSGLFLCVLFFAMTAASGAMGQEAFGVSYHVGVLFLLGLCFIVFLLDSRAVVMINGVLSPLMILSAILLGGAMLLNAAQQTASFGNGKNGISWIFSSLLYVSYNFIPAISVLVSLSSLIKSRKTSFLASLLAGGAICVMGVFVGVILVLNQHSVQLREIPLLGIIQSYGKEIQYCYIFMLAAAIITTAVGNGFGAIKWLESRCRVNRVFIAALFLVTAYFVSSLGFSGFVEKIYPLFGYLGLLEFGVIIIFFVRNCL